MASKIKVVVASGGTPAIKVGLVPSNTGSSFGTGGTAECADNAYGQVKYLGNSGGGHDIVTMKKYISTSEICGVPPAQVHTDVSFSAFNSTVPASQWFWHVLVTPMDGGSAVSCRVDVTITYYMEFFQRPVLGPS